MYHHQQQQDYHDESHDTNTNQNPSINQHKEEDAMLSSIMMMMVGRGYEDSMHHMEHPSHQQHPVLYHQHPNQHIHEHIDSLELPFVDTEDHSTRSEASSSSLSKPKPPSMKKLSRRWSKEEDKILQEAVSEHGEDDWKKVSQHIPGRNMAECFTRWKKNVGAGMRHGRWSKEEDEKLLQLVSADRIPSWSKIATEIHGRTSKQCRERYRNFLSPEVTNAPWTAEEDRILLYRHQLLGNRWAEIARYLEGRSANAVKTHFRALDRVRQNQSSSSSR